MELKFFNMNAKTIAVLVTLLFAATAYFGGPSPVLITLTGFVCYMIGYSEGAQNEAFSNMSKWGKEIYKASEDAHKIEIIEYIGDEIKSTTMEKDLTYLSGFKKVVHR